jgi:hypothetical protein
MLWPDPFCAQRPNAQLTPRVYIGPNLRNGDGMGRKKAAGHRSLAAVIEEARREVIATWAEAREDVRSFNASQRTDELEAAISACLRSQRKLVAAGERLKERLLQHRRTTTRS